MNVNPKAITILCYGDSNTWGQNEEKRVAGRYPVTVRWTGLLQQALGDSAYIIEEGLGGRTTDLEHLKADKPGRNGLSYFIPCFMSHEPVDVVVIMLGTNEMKIGYDRSVEAVAEGLSKYVAVVRDQSPDTRIILVSPIHVDDTAPLFKEYYSEFYDHTSAVKSQQLAGAIKALADQTGVQFFDASTVAHAGKDGIHFSPEAHAELAKALTGFIGTGE